MNAQFWEALATVHAVTGGGQWRGPSAFDCLLAGALLDDIGVLTCACGRGLRMAGSWSVMFRWVA